MRSTSRESRRKMKDLHHGRLRQVRMCPNSGCVWRLKRFLLARSLRLGNGSEFSREKRHRRRSVDLLVGENVVLEVTRHCDAFVVDQVRPNVILGELADLTKRGTGFGGMVEDSRSPLTPCLEPNFQSLPRSVSTPIPKAR